MPSQQQQTGLLETMESPSLEGRNNSAKALAESWQDADRDLIRSPARRLAEDGPDSAGIRATVSQTVAGEPVKKGGIEIRRGILGKPPGKRPDRLEVWFSGSQARKRCLPDVSYRSTNEPRSSGPG
jgi:hypothetical protein